MRSNPFGRAAAIVGLIGLAIIALMVLMGSLTMEEAATRAGITLGAVMVVRLLSRRGATVFVHSVERHVHNEASGS